LNQRGITVLGIGDESYENLHADIKENLREYFRVSNMEDYDQVYRAVGFFIHRYGRISHIESLNEHWQELEARLREDFNVEGYKTAQMDKYKRKSCMKTVFKEAGLPVAPGIRPASLEEALQFGREVGYPLILKPDIGVGAEGAKKIHNEAELTHCFAKQSDAFLEKFVVGVIETYDGLTDHLGNVIFYSSLGYAGGIMEMLNGIVKSIYFICKKEVPDDLKEAGDRVVKAFNVKSRFFHIEFFRTEDGTLLPLEMNLRPPGGITVDLWNYCHRMDLYSNYAHVIAKSPALPYKKPVHHCVYAARRTGVKYKYTHQDVVKRLGTKLELFTEMPQVFSGVMGNDAYVFVSDSEDEIRSTIEYIEARP
jgi:biotin carboxylase